MYAEWDDLEPPIVQVSADGSQAWMIVRLQVRRTKTVAGAAPAQEQFIYAGITTFAKWQVGEDGKRLDVRGIVAGREENT
jgi:hypothetical protein